MLQTIRNRKIQVYCLFVFIFGFLFSIFYQTVVVEEDFVKVDYEIDMSKKTDYHNLLSGWSISPDLVCTTGESANFLVDLSSTANCKIGFEIFVSKLAFEDKKDEIFEVFCNDVLIKKSNLKNSGWGEFSIVIPEKALKLGLNKIKLVNFPSGVTFRTLFITNFQMKRLLFLRTYMLWETVRIFARISFEKINLIFCIGSGFTLLVIWIAYSIIFRSFTVLSLHKVLSLDFWPYFFATIMLFILYLIKLLAFYNLFYYKLDFWLALCSVILTVKIVQLSLFIDKDVVRKKIANLTAQFIKIFSLKEILSIAFKEYRLRGKRRPNVMRLVFIVLKQMTVVSYRFVVGISMLLFMVLFFITWPFLYFKQKILTGATTEGSRKLAESLGNWAESLGNWAFLFLSICIIFKIIEHFTGKENSQNVN